MEETHRIKDKKRKKLDHGRKSTVPSKKKIKTKKYAPKEERGRAVQEERPHSNFNATKKSTKGKVTAQSFLKIESQGPVKKAIELKGR